jgi:hypothetical protein
MQQLEGCVLVKSACKFIELVSFHLMLEHKLIHGLWTIDHCAEVALLLWLISRVVTLSVASNARLIDFGA